MVKKKVTVVLLHDDEQGGDSVIIPTIPELATMGENVEHGFAMAKECLELSLKESTDWDYYDLDHAYSEHVVVGTIEVEVPDPPQTDKYNEDTAMTDAAVSVTTED